MPSLYVTAITISPDPKIANASASGSVTAHGIAFSTLISDSRRLDGPERVCEQCSRWRRTTVSVELGRLLLQALLPSDYLLLVFRPLSK